MQDNFTTISPLGRAHPKYFLCQLDVSLTRFFQLVALALDMGSKEGSWTSEAASCGQMTLRAGHELVLILLGTLGLPSARRQLLSAALFVLTLKDKFTYSSQGTGSKNIQTIRFTVFQYSRKQCSGAILFRPSVK